MNVSVRETAETLPVLADAGYSSGHECPERRAGGFARVVLVKVNKAGWPNWDVQHGIGALAAGECLGGSACRIDGTQLCRWCCGASPRDADVTPGDGHAWCAAGAIGRARRPMCGSNRSQTGPGEASTFVQTSASCGSTVCRGGQTGRSRKACWESGRDRRLDPVSSSASSRTSRRDIDIAARRESPLSADLPNEAAATQ